MTHASSTNASTGEPREPITSSGVAAVSLDADAMSVGQGLAHLALRWWPALVGLAFGIVNVLDIKPWEPSEPTTPMLPGLAIVYLVFGAVRGQLRRPGILRLEVVGLVIFGATALLAVLVDPEAGQYIAGAGFIGHAAWDVAHHRDLSRHHAVGVVPRGWSEFCIVIDLLIGASLIAAPIA